MSLRYHVWWFWHRFNPRRLWIKATTYQVPIRVDYGGQVSQQTYMRRKRWDRSIESYEASSNIRCPGDNDWRTIKGMVTYGYDEKDRLASINVHFELPCDRTDATGPFYIDDSYLGKGMP